MRKLVVLGVFALVASACGAQEYVGLTLGKSSIGGECPQGWVCQAGSLSGKLAVGAPLNGKLYAAGITAYELSYMRFGRSEQTYTAQLPNQLQDDLVAGTPVYGQYAKRRHASALAGALVARYSLFAEAQLALRAGVAYVTSASETMINGAHAGLATSSHVRPYMGLALDYQFIQGTKVAAGIDWTQYSVAGNKSSLMLLGLGVLQDF